jgi:Tol biopolymer transport system component
MRSAREDQFVELKQIWPEGAWPCFSPDGQYLVFTGNLKHPSSQLMMLPADGVGEPRCITPPEMNAKRPAWLHNVREIAFNRGQTSIWTLNLDSERIQPFLAESPAGSYSFVHPCAYPNERAVVVVCFRETANGREGELYKLTPGAEAPILRLTNFSDVCAGRPGVSPDGKAIVFAGNAGRFAQGANQLWVVEPNGKPRRLEQIEPTLAQGRAPRWSPDGKWIACTSTRPAPKPDENTPRAVWVISADGTEAHRLTDHSMNPLHVAWSPDQKRLACGGFGCGLALLELPERFRAARTQ